VLPELFLACSQEKAGPSYLVGPKLTYADVVAFCYVSFLTSGIFTGELFFKLFFSDDASNSYLISITLCGSLVTPRHVAGLGM
jgi:glutathione S-transferase